jgi:Fe-S-cluster containining protein
MIDLLDEIKDGFKFICIECGRCCKGVGDGYVFVFDREIKKICRFLKITQKEFKEKYSEEIEAEFRKFTHHYKPTKKKTYIKTSVLKQDKDDGSCIFLSSDLCRIYDVRPMQCRTWPCWHVIMTNKRQFENAVKKCPGINADEGQIVTKDKIIKILKQEIRKEQQFIRKNTKK